MGTWRWPSLISCQDSVQRGGGETSAQWKLLVQILMWSCCEFVTEIQSLASLYLIFTQTAGIKESLRRRASPEGRRKKSTKTHFRLWNSIAYSKKYICSDFTEYKLSSCLNPENDLRFRSLVRSGSSSCTWFSSPHPPHQCGFTHSHNRQKTNKCLLINKCTHCD